MIWSLIQKITAIATGQEKRITREYCDAGHQFAWLDGIYQTTSTNKRFDGIRTCFQETFHQWESLERAYAGLGYRTISLIDFKKSLKGRVSILQLIRIPLREGEEPIYYAERLKNLEAGDNSRLRFLNESKFRRFTE